MSTSKAERTTEIETYLSPSWAKILLDSKCHWLSDDINQSKENWLETGVSPEDPTKPLTAAQFLRWLVVAAIKSNADAFVLRMLLLSEKNPKPFIEIQHQPQIADIAIELGRTEHLKVMLESGFNPNGSKKRQHLFTALSHLPSTFEIIQILLLHGADPIQTNSEGIHFILAAKKVLNTDEFEKVMMCAIPQPILQELSKLIGEDGLSLLKTSKLLTAKCYDVIIHLQDYQSEYPGEPTRSAIHFLNNLYGWAYQYNLKKFGQHLLEKNADKQFLTETMLNLKMVKMTTEADPEPKQKTLTVDLEKESGNQVLTQPITPKKEDNATEQRLAELTALIGEDRPDGLDQLISCHQDNQQIIDDWLNFTGFPNTSADYSAKHFLQMMFDNAKRKGDKETEEFLKRGAPYIIVNPVQEEESRIGVSWPTTINIAGEEIAGVMKKAVPVKETLTDHTRRKSESKERALKLKQITEKIGEDGFAQLTEPVFAHNFVERWLAGMGDNYSVMELFDALLQEAANMKHNETYRFILDRKLHNINNPYILDYAVMGGKTKEEIQELIDLGFDVNGITFQANLQATGPVHANTPILTAYKHATPEIVQMLLEAGANPHQLNEHGITVFELAERAKNEDMIEILAPYKDREISVENVPKRAERKTVAEVIDQILYGKIPGDEEELQAAKVNLFQNIRDKWKAHGAPPQEKDVVTSMPYFTNKFLGRVGKVRIQPELNVENLSPEVKFAFQNMIAYAGKLLNERDHASAAKQTKLTTKLNAVVEFIHTILRQENLTEASIAEAYNTFERNDKNTGSGLFRFYSLINHMRYTDEHDKSRFVKSTLGELVFNFKEAVKAQSEKVADEASVHGDDSSHGL